MKTPAVKSMFAAAAAVAGLSLATIETVNGADTGASDRLSLIGQPSGFLVTVGPGPARDLCMVYGDRDYGTADRLAWPSLIPVGKVGASSENSVCKVPLPKGWGTASAKRLRILTIVSGRKDLDYTELEYVQSTASGAFCAQYVDTGIYPDGKTGVSMDFQIDSHTGQTGNEGSYSRLYGAMDDWNTRYLLTVGNAYDRVISWPYDSSASAGFITTRENMRMWYTNRYRTVQDMTGFSVTNLTTGESMKLDDFSGWGAKAPPANGTKQATHTLWLFGANAWQSLQVMGTVGKIYSCTIVTGVTQAVARDFVPAKQGNKVGLYDKVTKTIFCSNTGTALVAGPEIPPPPDVVYDWSASIRCDRLGLACTGGEQAVSVNMAGTLPVAPDAEHDRATRKHEGIPSFAIDQTSGRMWATWYGSPDGTTTYGENADNYVILATSDDGENWSEVAVADPDGLGGRRAFDPEIWIDDAGILHWSWTDAVEQKTDTMNLMEVTIPASTVPKAFPVAKCIGHGVMMCKPTKLADGRILYPVANWKSAPSANFFERNAEGVLEFVGGITIPQADRVFDEHIMIQRDGGSLYALVRGLGNPTALYESTSADGGQTWSAAVASALGHPSSRLFMRRLASGNVLLVKHGDIGETTTRTKLKAFLSEDGGATWKGGLLLDDASEGDVSYPDGDQGSDGVIHVIYDQDRLGKRNILLASFTEADVLAGTDVSGKVTLRCDVHHGKSFAGDEHRSLKAESVVPDFSVAIEPGESRELYMVYGRRDYGTEDPKKWPHCVKLASIPSSAESTVYAFSLPEGWGAANTKFRLFAVSDQVLLEYVQSTGSGSSQQWIDTGICPDGKTGVSIDFQVDSHTGWRDADGNWSRLYGAMDDWAFRYVLTIGNSTGRIIAWPYDSSASTGFSTAAGDVNIWSPNRYRTVQDMSGLSITNLTTGESMKYDDFANGYGAKAPPANGTKRLTSTLWLFGMNAKITVGRADTVGKIYSCTIVTGATQTVARDFVPAKQGDKVGLYDKVTKTLFCSASATPLVAGPEKQGGDVPVGWSELCESLPKMGLMLFVR